MVIRRRFIATICSGLFLLLGAVRLCPAQELTFTPYKASDIYDVGEKVGWKVALTPGSATQPAAAAGDYIYTIRKNNLDVIKTGKLDFSSGPDKIEVTLDEPAMVYVQITAPGDVAARAAGGCRRTRRGTQWAAGAGGGGGARSARPRSRVRRTSTASGIRRSRCFTRFQKTRC